MLYPFKYLFYKLFARHKHGFGIHSPFVYDFITGVLRNREYVEELNLIEELRKELLRSGESITFSEFGSGSRRLHSPQRKIVDIVRYSSMPGKYGRLLYRLIRFFNPNIIVELGTSLGISTLYLANANPSSEVYTIEGCPESARIAVDNFNRMNVKNIHLKIGRFDKAFSSLLEDLPGVDLIFFDGDHREESTMQYFNEALLFKHNGTIFVFDDIHLSKGMENAWRRIKQDHEVKVTIDLFRLGLVFFRKELQKQDFIIRF